MATDLNKRMFSNQLDTSTTRLRRLERGFIKYARASVVTPSGAFSPVSQNLFVGNGGAGQIQLGRANIGLQGSVAPVVTEAFTYTATSAQIVWTWAGVVIRRADGTRTSVPDGTITVTGLAATTDYYFLPFWSTWGCWGNVGWVTGTVGSPQIAFTLASQSLDALQQQVLQPREPLSNGYMKATTDVGGGGGTSGGGGGSVHCPRAGMLVESMTRGVIPVELCHVGEQIASGDSWTTIIAIQPMSCYHFVRIVTTAGEVEIDATAPQPMAFGGRDTMAIDLRLNDIVIARVGDGTVMGLEKIHDPAGRKISVSCHPSHHFWCGRHKPTIAIHNTMAKSL